MVRLKTRYLLFEVVFPLETSVDGAPPNPGRRATILDYRKVLRELKESVLENFGDFGVGQVQGSLAVKYFSPSTRMGIVRASRDHWRIVQAALSYITHVDNVPVIFRVVRVSGTIKKSEHAAIERNRTFIETAVSS